MYAKCGNFFCIYCKDSECTLKTISLDVCGTCENCVYVNINNKMLAELKEKQLVQQVYENE